MFYWSDELYSYSKIYDSLSPISRICVDFRIQGRKPAFIALHTHKPIKTIRQALWRAKKRYLAAILGEKSPDIENVYTRDSREIEIPNIYETI